METAYLATGVIITRHGDTKMDVKPFITMIFNSATPAADHEISERYNQWANEFYLPLYVKIPGVTGADRYAIVQPNPQYPEAGSFFHVESLGAWENVSRSPERLAINADLLAWEKRHVREYIWMAGYQLVKSIRSKIIESRENKDTKIEKAPFMHLEAYHLAPADRERFFNWFSEFGWNGCVPLLVKLPGLKGYDFLENAEIKPVIPVREMDYPPYLSIMYFEDKASFENYTHSQELAIFQKTMRNVFPLGLGLEWYVQYQLIKSFRK
jgi:hypothetical protein